MIIDDDDFDDLVTQKFNKHHCSFEEELKQQKELTQFLNDKINILLRDSPGSSSSSSSSFHSDEQLRLCSILKANIKEHHFSNFTK